MPVRGVTPPPPSPSTPATTPVTVQQGFPAPQRVALLLPLSGEQRPAAEAIRDGFIAAWLADAGNPLRPELLILDEQQPGPAEAYLAALDAGAGMVIGPLLKPSVAQVASVAGAVPTLLLNTLDATPPPARSYQFALAPEDEAEAIAERVLALGQGRALVLAPATAWGRRLLGAFAAALETRGGTVVEQQFYDPAERDYTGQLEQLLQLDASRNRQRRLVANVGVALEFEPRRRTDADCIVLMADAARGRLIRPQLRFLYAGDLPTYATSAIHQLGSPGDLDLDGIMFVDAPVTIGHDPRASALRAALAASWPPFAAGQLRFHAMGHDAYALVQELRSGNALVGMPYAGLSGILSLGGGQRIHRGMAWGLFREGEVVPLGEAPPMMPDGDSRGW